MLSTMGWFHSITSNSPGFCGIQTSQHSGISCKKAETQGLLLSHCRQVGSDIVPSHSLTLTPTLPRNSSMRAFFQKPPSGSTSKIHADCTPQLLCSFPLQSMEPPSRGHSFPLQVVVDLRPMRLTTVRLYDHFTTLRPECSASPPTQTAQFPPQRPPLLAC